MTYEEALEELEAHVAELGGIGHHTTPERAAMARRFALETLRKIAAATEVAIKELEAEHGYYLTE